ncbi:hypothetical protein FB451DRAFT_1166279 [Mycena latifolia]|nr:hypothetical protein FB451DRAFT_1166279 [Mycena latifolia]
MRDLVLLSEKKCEKGDVCSPQAEFKEDKKCGGRSPPAAEKGPAVAFNRGSNVLSVITQNSCREGRQEEESERVRPDRIFGPPLPRPPLLGPSLTRNQLKSGARKCVESIQVLIRTWPSTTTSFMGRHAKHLMVANHPLANQGSVHKCSATPQFPVELGKEREASEVALEVLEVVPFLELFFAQPGTREYVNLNHIQQIQLQIPIFWGHSTIPLIFIPNKYIYSNGLYGAPISNWKQAGGLRLIRRLPEELKLPKKQIPTCGTPSDSLCVWCINIKLGMMEASNTASDALGSLPSSSTISLDEFTWV